MDQMPTCDAKGVAHSDMNWVCMDLSMSTLSMNGSVTKNSPPKTFTFF